MHIAANTVDDLLRSVFKKLLSTKNRVNPTRGEATELLGVLLELRNPRARLSRTEMKGKLFSCLGELLWYLGKTNDLRFISYYLPRYADDSEDGRTIYGGYGPRLFNMRGVDQVSNVLELLRRNPDSRRAVIQLFDASDIAERHKEIPCTCTLQFMVRKHRLNMFTTMRSNDAYIGLPHDIFAFTMLQEILARTLGLEVGRYKHAVGSLHLYARNISDATRYLDEGWQSTFSMPAMPIDDPWPSIQKLLKAEAGIRLGRNVDIENLKIDDYWSDLARLLQIFKISKQKGSESSKSIGQTRRKMSTEIYNIYIAKRQARKTIQQVAPGQLVLPEL